jgi:hypothetical protein
MKRTTGRWATISTASRSLPVTVGRSILTYTASLGLARESESRTFCVQTLRCSVAG